MLEDEDRCNLVSRRQGSASPLVDARERHLAVTDLSCTTGWRREPARGRLLF